MQVLSNLWMGSWLHDFHIGSEFEKTIPFHNYFLFIINFLKIMKSYSFFELCIGWVFSLVYLIVAVICIGISWNYLNPEAVEKIDVTNMKSTDKIQTGKSMQENERTNQWVDDSFDSIGYYDNSCYITDRVRKYSLIIIFQKIVPLFLFFKYEMKLFQNLCSILFKIIIKKTRFSIVF